MQLPAGSPLIPRDRMDSLGDFIRAVSDETGEIVLEVAVPPGHHLVRNFMRQLPDGCHFVAGQGITVTRRPAVTINKVHLEEARSAANPVWRATPLSRKERQLRESLNRVSVMEKRLAARERAERRALQTGRVEMQAAKAAAEAAAAEAAAAEAAAAEAESEAEGAAPKA